VTVLRDTQRGLIGQVSGSEVLGSERDGLPDTKVTVCSIA